MISLGPLCIWRKLGGGGWVKDVYVWVLWTRLLLGLALASWSVQPVGEEGRTGYGMGDGRGLFLLGICKLVGSVLPPGFRQSQGPFALAGSLTRPAGMTIALSTVLTGRKEEGKSERGEQCSGLCSTITAPLNSNGYLPTAALAGTGGAGGRWGRSIKGRCRFYGPPTSTRPPLPPRAPGFFLFHLIPGHS